MTVNLPSSFQDVLMDWEAQEPERGKEGFTGMEGEADAEARATPSNVGQAQHFAKGKSHW